MIDSKEVSKAIGMLRRFSDQRQILVKDKRESGIPGSWLGFVRQQEDRIEIYCDMSCSEGVRQAIVVHEILHKILGHEGFPQVSINETASRALLPQHQKLLAKLKDRFKSAIDHPEIFRRILSCFELDIDSYFGVQVKQKLHMFGSRSARGIGTSPWYYFEGQQDIMWGVEFFSYPSAHRDLILSAFANSNPESYQSCLSLYGKVKEIGFENPMACYRSALIMKSHILEYGQRRAIGRLNDIWRALEVREQAASSEFASPSVK
jgi:hypothetical protein